MSATMVRRTRIDRDPILAKMLDGPKTRKQLGISLPLAKRMLDERLIVKRSETIKHTDEDGNTLRGRPSFTYRLTGKGRHRAKKYTNL